MSSAPIFDTAKPLRDLPNQVGYRFVGIDLDGKEHPCIVVKDAVGCHTVKRISDMEPFFFQLHSWRNHDKSSRWIDVSKETPSQGKPMKMDALGVEVLIWPRMEDGATAYFGRRITHRPTFYKHGAVLHYVTHWMPLPKGPK